MGGGAGHGLPLQADLAAEQLGVGDGGQLRFDPAGHREVQHRDLQLLRTGGRLKRHPGVDQGHRRRDRHQQGAAMAFKKTGPHPFRAQGVQVDADRGGGPWGAGMAAGLALAARLVAAARPNHPTQATSHQHR